jgi:hypothetical protein
LAQENFPFAPGLGPNASAGSPSETSPFWKYFGSVPIGPTSGWHGGSLLPTTPRQFLAVQPR